MLDKASETIPDGTGLPPHSDQGWQWRYSPQWMLKEKGIRQSMDRKGHRLDNATAENFFAILKTECIDCHKSDTFSEANKMIDQYIHFYNHEHIQLKTREAPLERHLSA